MACAGRIKNGETWCSVCAIKWPNGQPPSCPRGCDGPLNAEGVHGGDPRLSAEEVRALKAAEVEWLNKQRRRGKRGGGWRGKSGATVTAKVGETLKAFNLVFQSTPYQSLRATNYGTAWLDRHVKGRGENV